MAEPLELDTCHAKDKHQTKTTNFYFIIKINQRTLHLLRISESNSDHITVNCLCTLLSHILQASQLR